jgi:hypothetical protein
MVIFWRARSSGGLLFHFSLFPSHRAGVRRFYKKKITKRK